jgi:peptide deformylase
MSVLSILQLDREAFTIPDTSLRLSSHEVLAFDGKFQKLVDDLIDTLKHHRIAVGLAAPQVGVALKVAVINLREDKLEPTLVIANPQVLSVSGKKEKKKESCMSLPHFRGEVERRDKIAVSYQDRFGARMTLKAEGFLARVVAHEIDHLDGVLYVDRMVALSNLEPVDFFKG